MASLHRRKDSPYWIIAYTDPRGRRLKRSSKTTSHKEALRVARDWEEAILLARSRQAVAKQYRTVFKTIRDMPALFPEGLPPAPENAPNQRELAARLGVSQSTVSLALRGDRSISRAMRDKIQETAKQWGYHSNAYVDALMTRVRSGRRINDKGAIAMLVDFPSAQDWLAVQSFRAFHDGVLLRGRDLGFHVEAFYLQNPDTAPARIDRILMARGIRGLILAPPYRGNRSLPLSWEHYASVGVGFGWEDQELDRVVFDSLNNYITAFEALRKLGYRRIGTALPRRFTTGSYCGTKWFTGFLDCQNRLPVGQRIPVCRLPNYGRGTQFNAAVNELRWRTLEEWRKKWHPDALLTLAGHEHAWLDSQKIRYPREIGLACLAQPARKEFAHIEERAEEVGATALEWVSTKISRNEYNRPRCPKVMMVEGQWMMGSSVVNQSRSRSCPAHC